eukprot:3055146-Amphidinium_carterae.1
MEWSSINSAAGGQRLPQDDLQVLGTKCPPTDANTPKRSRPPLKCPNSIAKPHFAKLATPPQKSNNSDGFNMSRSGLFSFLHNGFNTRQNL